MILAEVSRSSDAQNKVGIVATMSALGTKPTFDIRQKHGKTPVISL